MTELKYVVMCRFSSTLSHMEKCISSGGEIACEKHIYRTVCLVQEYLANGVSVFSHTK